MRDLTTRLLSWLIGPLPFEIVTGEAGSEWWRGRRHGVF